MPGDRGDGPDAVSGADPVSGADRDADRGGGALLEGAAWRGHADRVRGRVSHRGGSRRGCRDHVRRAGGRVPAPRREGRGPGALFHPGARGAAATPEHRGRAAARAAQGGDAREPPLPQAAGLGRAGSDRPGGGGGPHRRGVRGHPAVRGVSRPPAPGPAQRAVPAARDRGGHGAGAGAGLFVELDNFKQWNDRFGHEAGNDVLKSTARECAAHIRTTDLAARYGGDEFVLVVVHTGVEGARVVADKVRTGVEVMGRDLGYPAGLVTVSIGVAELAPQQGPEREEVRNIESALMAQLGVKIDHRKISVAQTADVRPIEQMQEEAVRTRAKKRVVIFQGLEVRPAERPQRVLIRVKLSFEGRDAESEEQGTDTVRNRVEAAARAASLCLDELLSDKSVASRGATIIEAFDRKFVLVAVHGLGGREAQLLTGTCEIRESPERSSVLAVLDATNRWADARR